MIAAPHSRPPLERFHRIVEHLRVGRAVTIKSIAEDLEVNRKTIERDADFMIDRLGVPMERTMQGLLLTKKLKICPLCVRQMKGN